MNFKDKTAISTGAASGMGLLFSKNFAQLGGNVLMVDVNEEVLKEKAEEINKEETERLAEIICPHGFQVLLIDLPEHGERKNEPAKLAPWVAVPDGAALAFIYDLTYVLKLN